MAISGEDVKVFIWRFLKFTLKSACRIGKNHPFVSCTLLFFLVLHACFPSFFWILIYSLAFVILAASITRIYFIFQNAKNFRRDEKNCDHTSLRNSNVEKNEGTEAGNEFYFRRVRSVRRRKSRETSRDTSLQTSEDEKSTVVSIASNDDMIDKSTFIEDKPKEIREIEMDSVISSQGLRPEICETIYGKSRKFVSGGELESAASSEEEDEHEKEENNKAVQWNENDQKNLMDLGFSEIERNKRLESLIARRRARKSSLQARRSVMNMNKNEAPGPISSLMITRNNPFLPNPFTGQFSPMPGSAPSILVPMSNPFDLPYDPHEERPNLTGGSFHLEFTAAHHRDLMFCRHESFSLGASFPWEFKDDQQGTSLPRDSANNQRGSEFILRSGLDGKYTDKIIEVESCQTSKSNASFNEVQGTEKEMDLVDHHQGERSSEVQTKSILVEDSNEKLSSTSSSEEDYPASRVDKEAILKSLASPVVRSFSRNREFGTHIGDILDSDGSFPFHKSSMEEHFFFADKARHQHTPTYSIASDLQVEVSEVGSPPLTIDGNNSSPDEDYPSFKGDMENESTSGNEDMWGKSSQLSREDENESISKEIYEVNEDNNVEFESLRTKISEDLLVSDDLGKKVAEQDTTDAFSWSDSGAKSPHSSQDHPSGFHSNIEEDASYASTSTSDTLGFTVIEKEQQLTGSPTTDSSQYDVDKSEQVSYSSEKSSSELNNTNLIDDPIVAEKNHTESRKETSCIVFQLNKQEVEVEQTELPETSSQKAVEYIGGQPQKIDQHQSILEEYRPVGKIENSKSSEDSEEETEAVPKQENRRESMPVEDNDTLEPEGEQHAAELRNPHVNESSIHHQVSVLVPEPVLERIPVASSTRSPRSVLQPKFSMDQIMSNYTEDMHADIQQIDPQIAENSMLNEATLEGSISTTPQSIMLSPEDSISRPIHSRDAEILQESSNLSSSAEEANSKGPLSEQAVHENEGREKQTKDIPECSSERWSNVEETAAVSETTTDIGHRSKEIHHHKASSPPALATSVAQDNQLNRSSINKEEVSEYERNPFGVFQKEKITNTVVGDARASSNATTSKDFEHNQNEPKDLAAGTDRTGLSVLLETSKRSRVKNPSTLPDENKHGFTEPFGGESSICTAEEITKVEPSKLMDKNNSSMDYSANAQAQIPPNDHSGRSSEEVAGNSSSSYEMVVSRLEEQSKDQLRSLKEALKD